MVMTDKPHMAGHQDQPDADTTNDEELAPEVSQSAEESQARADVEKLEALKARIQAKLAENRRRKAEKRQNPDFRPPRYDEGFFLGMEWLESLAFPEDAEQQEEQDMTDATAMLEALGLPDYGWVQHHDPVDFRALEFVGGTTDRLTIRLWFEVHEEDRGELTQSET